MYSKWLTFLIFLFPVFGMVSCTPDKPPTTIYVSDTWELPDPVLEVQRTNGTVRSSFLNSIEAIPIHSRIIFPFSNPADAQGVHWKVTSVCQRPEELSTTEVFVFQNVGSIPLLSLIPSDLLKKVAPSPTDPDCAFDFEAKREMGSTHSFTLSGRRITIEPVVAQPALEFGIARFDGARTDYSSLLPARELDFDRVEVLTYSLICENFRNERSVRRDVANQELINELIGGEIENGSGIEQPSSSDPRHRKPDQDCKIFLEGVDPATGMFQRSMTTVFKARFPLFPLNFSMDATRTLPTHEALHGRIVGTLLIANPNDFAIQLRVPTQRPDQMNLQLVNNTAGRVSMGAPFSSPFEIEVSGIERIFAVGDDRVFEIPPKQNANLSFKILTNRNCWISRFPDRTPLPYFEYVTGFAFDIPAGLGLRQYLPTTNASSSEGRSEPIETGSVRWSSEGERMLSNWVPLDYFAYLFAKKEQVLEAPVDPKPTAEWCQPPEFAKTMFN